ncbi:hypothetical protein TNCV_3213591 [Trichonephila clavipes]|nr:hypothetical protein TNCV_3213591 [Trichonephila clavipes]
MQGSQMERRKSIFASVPGDVNSNIRNIKYFDLAGWRGWFVTGLLHPRLRVRSRPKSEDFHDAENRQWLCCGIIQHVKDP